MTPLAVPVALDDADTALALGDLAGVLALHATPFSRWAVSGPGVVTLRHGGIQPARLGIIASGDGMLEAARIANREKSASLDGFETDFAFTPKWWPVDRPSIARAYRFALANPEIVTLEVAETHIAIPVIRPFEAYIVELARLQEMPRNSAARAETGGRALELYRRIGASAIDDHFADLQLRSRTELRDAGLRRSSVDEFKRWHSASMKERSPKPQALGQRFRGWASSVHALFDLPAGETPQTPQTPRRGQGPSLGD